MQLDRVWRLNNRPDVGSMIQRCTSGSRAGVKRGRDQVTARGKPSSKGLNYDHQLTNTGNNKLSSASRVLLYLSYQDQDPEATHTA